MSDRHERNARKVVEAFRELLPDEAVRALRDSELDELEDLIQEALADELHHATEQMDTLLRSMRTEVNLPELGM